MDFRLYVDESGNSEVEGATFLAAGLVLPGPPDNDQDAWLRGCLQWLSRESA